MSDHFHQELDNLKNSLVKMASLVDEQAERAFTALETGNTELCKGLKRKELEVDLYDNVIQTQCENILALFQPVAADLRFIVSALMINNQLERCGDIAVNISRRIKKIGNNHELIMESQILDMGNQAKEMLKNAINSFIQNDLDVAKSVLASDAGVDKLNKSIFGFLIAKMQIQPEMVEPCAHLIVMTRNIERLADHATNIAEHLVFYLEAKIITHQKKLANRTQVLKTVEL